MTTNNTKHEKIIKIMRAMKSKCFRRVRFTSVLGNITLTDKIKPKCAECTTGEKMIKDGED